MLMRARLELRFTVLFLCKNLIEVAVLFFFFNKPSKAQLIICFLWQRVWIRLNRKGISWEA